MAMPVVIASIAATDEAGNPAFIDIRQDVSPVRGLPGTTPAAAIPRLRSDNRQLFADGIGRFKDAEGRIFLAVPPPTA